MREIALFVEDFAHQEIIGAILQRLAQDAGVRLNLDWRSARHGHGKVVQEFKEYVRDLRNQDQSLPDLIVIATDANCKGLQSRTNEFASLDAPAPLILAIPDPHIERWLLLDGAAFKDVFGKGCDKPDKKCARDRYKQRLITEIVAANVQPNLGGIEFAHDIVGQMDIDRAARDDPSLQRFVNEFRKKLREWEY
ncbi:MAG: DUF4276 family protein [Defluviicoccus sp.]|nr:DUF4276 family protein [Defluviicoccus sp.]MDG4608193.1 DUF4276 family protein [Defluviicoccus sp.]